MASSNADSPRAAAAAGIHVRGVKLTGYALSSAIAGIAGVLYAYNFGSVSPSRFSALAALGLIGFAYIGGISSVGGAVFAGLFGTEALAPHAMEDWLGISGTWALLFGGVSLVATLIGNPDGIAGARRRRRAARKANSATAPATLEVQR